MTPRRGGGQYKKFGRLIAVSGQFQGGRWQFQRIKKWEAVSRPPPITKQIIIDKYLCTNIISFAFGSNPKQSIKRNTSVTFFVHIINV